MNIIPLVNVTAKAWALPILASLHDGVPGRQAALVKATGAGRTAFSQSMDHLIEIGLMERNPGHGHPLRPEFRLTPSGARIAAMASAACHAVPLEDRDLLRRSWTVPVLASLRSPSHFSEIRRGLGKITDRALSQSLQSLEERHWVVREVDAGMRPPRPVYSAVDVGARISQSELAGLALVA